MQHTMAYDNTLVEWAAVLGWGYGVLSDCLGESTRIRVNSVARLVLQGISALVSSDWHRRILTPAAPAATSDVAQQKPADLIALGYELRARYLKHPDIERVDVGIMGRHLVLTIYKASPRQGVSLN